MEKATAIVNRVFPGLTLFYRDTNLPEACKDKYVVGSIIIERGFTDCTAIGAGLAKSHRFLIASAHARDLSLFSPNPQQRLCVLQAGAFFKVLDIVKSGAESVKTQIMLLHLPDREAADFFAAAQFNLEDRKSFESKLAQQPSSALDESFYRRLEAPLAMLDDGQLFPLPDTGGGGD